MTCHRRLACYLGIILMSMMAVSWLQTPRLSDPYQVDEDFRSFYFLRILDDPELFPHFQSERSTSQDVIHIFGRRIPWLTYSPGYSALVLIGGWAGLSPVLVSKLIAFYLLPLTVAIQLRHGEEVRGLRTAVALAIGFVLLNLASDTSLSVLTGLQRGFALSLMIALLHCLSVGRFGGALVVMGLSAAIYPPVFALGAATWGLSMLRTLFKGSGKLKVAGPSFTYLILAGLLGTVILVPYLVARFHGSTQVVTPASGGVPLLQNPTYSAGGRRPLFDLFPLIGRGGLVNKYVDAFHILILVTVAWLIYKNLGRQALRIPTVMWDFLWASLIMFALSWAAALLAGSFILYLPSRYTRVGLVLFLLYFVTLNLPSAWRKIRTNPFYCFAGLAVAAAAMISLVAIANRVGVRLAASALGVVCVTLAGLLMARSRVFSVPLASRISWGVVITCLLLSWAVYARRVSAASFLNPPPEERELLETIATLPKDAMIGGTPCAIDNVPLFAGRQILFGCERVSDDAELTRSGLRAYYSSDPGELLGFCRTYGVDYLVIDERWYRDELLAMERLYYDPYNDELVEFVQAQPSFAVMQAPRDQALFTSGPLILVSCEAESLGLEVDTDDA